MRKTKEAGARKVEKEKYSEITQKQLKAGLLTERVLISDRPGYTGVETQVSPN